MKLKLSLLTNASLVLPKQVAPKQQGGMLIESLIGVLIMAIIGGGIMHVTARMLNNQHDVAVTNVTINELRPLIMSRQANGEALCGATTTTDAGTGVETTTYTAATATINVPGATSALSVSTSNCTPTTITIKNGNTLVATVTDAPQPVILSVGNSSDGSLIKVGGQ